MRSDTGMEGHVARFTDGQSASSVDATVNLTDRGVAIYRRGSDEPLLWPYGALDTAEPLTRHAIDALLTYRYQPGATLFVADADFARELVSFAPHLTASAQRWRAARPWLWGAAAAILFAVAISLAGLSPASWVASLLPDSARTMLGKQVLAGMIEGRRVCVAPRGLAALERLTARLSQGVNGKSFEIVVVDWDLFNAFATPGEQIVLTKGLIDKAEGPDELAGVLAHEMGHGIRLHPEAAIVRGIGLAAAAELMLGGSGGTLANAGLLLAQLSYSRGAEREADEEALRLLKGAKVSAYGLLAFFDRVLALEQKQNGDSGARALNVLSSHPLTEERRARVEAEPPYPSSPSMSEEDWKALKSICAEPIRKDPNAKEI